MYEKPLVFRGNESVDDVRRNVIVINKYAPALPDFLDEISVAAENAQRDLQRDIANSLRGRQPGGYEIIGADDAGNARNGRHDGQPGHHGQGAPEPPVGPLNGLLPRLSHMCSTHA